jgi:predicted ArsR family transcriptional regulator
MRDVIELFLRKNPSKSFKAGEISRRLKIPKGEVKRRLKKLAKKGTVAVKQGRYRNFKKRRASSAHPSLRKLEETAGKVGISVETLQRWVEEKKGRTTEEESRKILRRILNDVERSRGKNAPNKPGA